MSIEHADQLFDGILASARSESEMILGKARQDAQAVRESYDRKIEALKEAELKATEKRLEHIRKMTESTIRNLKRRYAVSHDQQLRTLVISLVSQKMATLVGTEAYRSVLIGWIAEAAIGLNSPEAQVACSFRETLDVQMMREAEDVVRRATGKQVHLRVHDEPLSAQGIEVSTPDGKIAYNNQVSTRLLRHERDLKELMEGLACHKES